MNKEISIHTPKRPSLIRADSKAFTDWMSGLVAGLVSVTACAPLDLARTRQMLMSHAKSHIQYGGLYNTISKIYREEGIRALYQGYRVSAVGVPVFNSLYFCLFYKFNEFFSKTDSSQDKRRVGEIMSAITTGVICNTITNPLWVVKTRVQSQYLYSEKHYGSITASLRRIYTFEGFGALYKGLLASYIGILHPTILYPLYEGVKRQIKIYKGDTNHFDHFGASMVAKSIATVLTYPHVILRTRLMDSRDSKIRTGNSSNSEWQQTKKFIQDTWRKEGVRGFYSGLRSDLARSLPANSLTFVVFEAMKQQFEVSSKSF